jgi:hypothetical protein
MHELKGGFSEDVAERVIGLTPLHAELDNIPDRLVGYALVTPRIETVSRISLLPSPREVVHWYEPLSRTYLANVCKFCEG